MTKPKVQARVPASRVPASRVPASRASDEAEREHIQAVRGEPSVERIENRQAPLFGTAIGCLVQQSGARPVRAERDIYASSQRIVVNRGPPIRPRLTASDSRILFGGCAICDDGMLAECPTEFSNSREIRQRSRDAECARGLHSKPSRIRGRREDRVPARTRGPCALVVSTR